MRTPSLLIPLIVLGAVPLAAQPSTSVIVKGANVGVGSLPNVGATWSGPTPACRLDRCGPNEIRVCLLRFCEPDAAPVLPSVSQRLLASPPPAVTMDAAEWRRLLVAARSAPIQGPVPAPRPRR
jgi:hypothetical protein